MNTTKPLWFCVEVPECEICVMTRGKSLVR